MPLLSFFRLGTGRLAIHRSRHRSILFDRLRFPHGDWLVYHIALCSVHPQHRRVHRTPILSSLQLAIELNSLKRDELCLMFPLLLFVNARETSLFFD